MKIELNKIKIADVCKNYSNNDEEGVFGCDGKLNIRPKYQREFVYKDDKRNAVIDTIKKSFPLNVMYWCKNDDGTYEVLDGQQRTISICEYVAGNFSFNNMYFQNLTDTEQSQILNYELMIYICEGNDKEKLDWFKIINIAGEKLTDQELRNAIYTGEWLSDAKRYFSKNNCAAYNIGNKLLNGAPNRQEYLETAIKWINKGKVEDYMAINQNNPNANELWLYFKNVIDWVNVIFPKYRKEMKGLDWGLYYNEYKNMKLDAKQLEEQVSKLMMDDEVTSKKGIYEFLLDGKEKHLSLRAFTESVKRETYEKQKGICVKCRNHFELNEMQADHIVPWSKSGKTNAENCQMLCQHCNAIKSDK
ncbi:MAG: HNH endonuclease [Alphaproteobacteria bacterium ADurb.Bin438]|nr:MAG: HNH endonuclease [Alphaproteobacteria bacterium ADurb.Bin438]